LTFDAVVEAPLDGVEYNNIAEITEIDQFDTDSTPGNGPDTDGDGLIGSGDDNPNDPGIDPDDEDDADDEPVTPQVADVSLIKTVDNPTPSIGTEVTWTVTVTNDGPAAATNVVVVDELPEGLVVTGTDASQGAVDGLTWTVGDLAVGASATLDITTLVEGSDVIINVASVTEMDQFDVDSEPGNPADTDDDGLIGSEDDNPNDTGVDPDDEDDADDEPIEPTLLSIGSNVFVDNNNDGMRDDDEPGIEGLLVEIFNTGDDGIAENADDELVGSDVTDENGDYFVDNLEPGDYYASISDVDEDFPASSTPTNLTPNDDTDNDDNGIQDAIGDGVWSNVITLTAQEEPSDEPGSGGDQDDADDLNGNMTLDFGFAPLVSVGSTVFVDNDDSGTQEDDEPGIEGVTIMVFDRLLCR